MSRTALVKSSSFPQWVAGCSLGLGLWLYFGNTVPALRDRAELAVMENDLALLRQRYDTAIGEARLGQGATADFDLQSLFVAIDQKGYTPAEFCAAYPSEPPARAASATADDPAATDAAAGAKFR